MRSALGIFGGMAGAIVVVLVGRYGYITSDTVLDGVIAGFFFAVIALGGIGGPAVAVHLFRAAQGWQKAWGLIAAVVALVALATNLSNSLGAIAGRADKTLAERKSATEATKDARAAIARLTKQLGELPQFSPATADDVAAARSAVQAAEKATVAECGDGTNPKQRGPRCRDRETEERTARDVLKSVLANKGLTDQAARVNEDLAAERRKLEKAPAVSSANPLAETLARVLSMQADDAATWQQIATVVVVELLIAFALIAWELLRTDAASHRPPRLSVEAAQERREDGAASTPLAALPGIAPALPAPEVGSVARFMLACLPRAKGGQVTRGAVYKRYLRWCDEQEPRIDALPIPAFWEQFAPLCNRVRIRMREKGGKVYCIDVRLAA